MQILKPSHHQRKGWSRCWWCPKPPSLCCLWSCCVCVSASSWRRTCELRRRAPYWNLLSFLSHCVCGKTLGPSCIKTKTSTEWSHCNCAKTSEWFVFQREKKRIFFHSHVFAGDLSSLDLLCVLIQLPGHPCSEAALRQRLVHVQDVVLLEIEVPLGLPKSVVKCSVGGETFREGFKRINAE